METKTCCSCRRDFIPTGCGRHCVPQCCRQDGCSNTSPSLSPTERRGRQNAKRCIVCGIPGNYFQAFAPCDKSCSRIFYASTRVGAGTQGYIKRVWLCAAHHPAGKPRVHIDYCSIRCYNNTERGHHARVKQGRSNRRLRWWLSKGYSKELYKRDLKKRTYTGKSSFLSI